MTNKHENETKKIEIEYIDLKEIYGSKDSIKSNDVNNFIITVLSK